MYYNLLYYVDYLNILENDIAYMDCPISNSN